MMMSYIFHHRRQLLPNKKTTPFILAFDTTPTLAFAGYPGAQVGGGSPWLSNPSLLPSSVLWWGIITRPLLSRELGLQR